MMTILDNMGRWCLIIVLTAYGAMLSAQTTADGANDLVEAKAYLARNLLAEAESSARAAITAQQHSPDARSLLGYILFRQGKARESLAEYTEASKYRTPSAADLRVVGADYVILSAFADADKWFTKATEMDAANVLGWYYLGRTKYNENRFEEAVSAFERCLALSPRHVRAEDNLGLSLQGLGRREEALQAFRNAIDWQANVAAKDPWPYIDFGSFLLEIDQPDPAIVQLQRAVELVPESPKAHQQLGKAYLAVKQFTKAQAELEAAIKLDPNSAPTHYILGQLYQKHGEAEKAKLEFARYSQLSANHQDDSGRDFPSAAPK